MSVRRPAIEIQCLSKMIRDSATEHDIKLNVLCCNLLPVVVLAVEVELSELISFRTYTHEHSEVYLNSHMSQESV